MSTIIKNVNVSIDTDVEVEVSLSDFSIDEVLEILEDDGYVFISQDLGFDQKSYKQALDKLCHLYRANDESFRQEIGVFLSNLSGRIL
jgi:peroxiredoxin